jgi:hypothetical protein
MGLTCRDSLLIMMTPKLLREPFFLLKFPARKIPKSHHSRYIAGGQELIIPEWLIKKEEVVIYRGRVYPYKAKIISLSNKCCMGL